MDVQITEEPSLTPVIREAFPPGVLCVELVCRRLDDLLQGCAPWRVSGYCNTSSTCSTVKATRWATPVTPCGIYNTASTQQTTSHETCDTSFPCHTTEVHSTALLSEICNNSIAGRLPAWSKSTRHRQVPSQFQFHKTIKPRSHSLSSDKENSEAMPDKWPQEYAQHHFNPTKTTWKCGWRGQGNARRITERRRSQRIEKLLRIRYNL